MIDLIPNKKGIYIRDGTNTYCVRPPCFSLRNYRNLKERSLIIGFVGARGSGKSVGAARTVIMDYMLQGKRNVWSNMEIGFNLITNGQSIPMKSKSLERLGLVELDEMYNDGLLYVDEVNLLAEARRSMSQSNLMFSYILQQLRKRRLSIIWSAQSEMHCDDRLRFQTDIFIMCEDVSISRPKCGIGELSLWKAHDFSGIVKGKTPRNSEDAVFYRGVQWNKPWWNTFSTFEIQDVEMVLSSEKDVRQKEAERIAAEIAEEMKVSSGRMSKREIGKKYGILEDRGMQIKVGQLLSSRHGIVKEDYKPSSRFYVVEDELIGEVG